MTNISTYDFLKLYIKIGNFLNFKYSLNVIDKIADKKGI